MSMITPISTATTLPVDWRALCKALMDAIDDGIPAERIKQSPMAVLYDAAMAQPEPEIEPAAYLHRQGNYTEASERSLSEDEKARGWTEEPLFRHPLAQPEPEGPTDEELYQF
jgi:hypothetical protein